MVAKMVITASTNIIKNAEPPNDCAEAIKLVIKPIVLKLCANTPAATKSITTPAKASAIPRYATMRLSKVCFALKLRKKSTVAVMIKQSTITVTMCKFGKPHLPSKINTPIIGNNGKIA